MFEHLTPKEKKTLSDVINRLNECGLSIGAIIEVLQPIEKIKLSGRGDLPQATALIDYIKSQLKSQANTEKDALTRYMKMVIDLQDSLLNIQSAIDKYSFSLHKTMQNA